MIAVSDASPLIVFARASRLALLRRVFEFLVIPPRVAGESFRNVPSRPGAAELAALRGVWLRQAAPVNRSAIEALERRVDPGEAEAIVLASERGLPLLIDDRGGRRAARQLGIEVVGSLGVLLRAKQLGAIPAVRPVLDDLLAEGLRLSLALHRQALQDAGERL